MNKQTTFVAVAMLAAMTTGAATAQDQSSPLKHFDGPYVGADIGLTDGGKFYYGTNLGLRKQTDNNMVFGVEGTFGDYALSEELSIEGQSITAGIDYTWSINGYVGWVFGNEKNNLLKIGGGYNNIHVFASSATESAGDTVSDFTAFVGYERAFSNDISLRVQANYLTIEDAKGTQATIGLAYNF